MSEDKCGNCKWHAPDEETGTGRSYCIAIGGPHCGEWTTDGFACGMWEQAQTETPEPKTIRQRLLEGDWHDKTPKEIAEALGVSAGGVNSALSVLRREGMDVPHIGTERKKGGKKGRREAEVGISKMETTTDTPSTAAIMEYCAGRSCAECPMIVDRCPDYDGERPEAATVAKMETVGRAECLSRALSCVCGERESDYGSPEDSFGKIAALWSAYRGETYTAQDVAVMMSLLKIARIGGGRATVDSWVDLAGYAACGCELSTRETET